MLGWKIITGSEAQFYEITLFGGKRMLSHLWKLFVYAVMENKMHLKDVLFIMLMLHSCKPTAFLYDMPSVRTAPHIGPRGCCSDDVYLKDVIIKYVLDKHSFPAFTLY